MVTRNGREIQVMFRRTRRRERRTMERMPWQRVYQVLVERNLRLVRRRNYRELAKEMRDNFPMVSEGRVGVVVGGVERRTLTRGIRVGAKMQPVFLLGKDLVSCERWWPCLWLSLSEAACSSWLGQRVGCRLRPTCPEWTPS